MAAPEAPWFVRSRLKTRQLLLIAVLAEEGNIHRTAERLSIAQPAASRLLKELEESLGVTLFERVPRGMVPTLYGETMIRHARNALASLNLAHQELTALMQGLQGTVRVGAITAPALGLMPLAFAKVRQMSQKLRISFEIATSPVLLEALEQDKLDIVIGRLPADADKPHLNFEILAEEPVCAMVRPGHPMLQATHLKLSDLAAASWILPPAGSVLRRRFELMFRQRQLLPPTDIIETAALLFMTRMLERSDMLAVYATEVIQFYASHGIVAVLPFELACDMDAYGIITRADRPFSPAMHATVEAIRAAAGILSAPAALTPDPP